jgi:hypothetical protein
VTSPPPWTLFVSFCEACGACCTHMADSCHSCPC